MTRLRPSFMKRCCARRAPCLIARGMKITICRLTSAIAATGTLRRKAKKGAGPRDTAVKRAAWPAVILGNGRPSAINDALRSETPAGMSDTTNATLRRAANAENVERSGWQASTASSATVEQPNTSVPNHSAAPPAAVLRAVGEVQTVRCIPRRPVPALRLAAVSRADPPPVEASRRCPCPAEEARRKQQPRRWPAHRLGRSDGSCPEPSPAAGPPAKS